MANTTTNKKTTNTSKRTTTKKPTSPKTSVVAEETVETVDTQQIVNSIPSKAPKREIDLNEIVPVINNTRGTLVYVSRRMQGYEIVWRNFGEVEYVEYGELVSMRNSAKSFFTENWIMIEDKFILDALGVSKYYKNIPTPEEFDDIFSLSSSEIQIKVAEMSEGMKSTIALRAVEMIESGELDSRKMINALEVALGRELIEKN